MSFSWKGVSSDAMGVAVMRLPDIIAPARRGETYAIPGAGGTLFVPDGGREEMTLLAECYLPYEQGGEVASMDEIRTWLTGSGWWTQSDVPGRKFSARITDMISFQPLVPGFDDRVFGLTLYAQPWQYIDPEAADILLTAPGAVTNPGNAAAEPLITVSGSGNISISVGGRTIMLTGLTGSAVIDCGAKLVYSGTTLLTGSTTLAQKEWPVLQPGNNAVSWTGSVTKLTITPRWRFE